jgi:ferredoxin--NADP+ reductase
MSEAVKHLRDYDTERRHAAVLVSSERITSEESDEEVRELLIDVDLEDFSFKVGQSIGVLAPPDGSFGQKHHFRLYSVAVLPERGESGKPRIMICVRRCSYVDEYSGEQYQGIASNYLCDLSKGDSLTITGPYGIPFEVPEERDATLILIGTGTGIAPFRAFVKRLYQEDSGFEGRVLLFYGAKSGLELLYMNDEKNDFSQYYDKETFEAFTALSPRPNWADPIGWDQAFAERGEEIWKLLGFPKTHVYVAGLEKMRNELDGVFSNLAGGEDKWARRKAELLAGRRWVELIY